jgi:hypothetical protein
MAHQTSVGAISCETRTVRPRGAAAEAERMAIPSRSPTSGPHCRVVLGDQGVEPRGEPSRHPGHGTGSALPQAVLGVRIAERGSRAA